MCRIHKLANFHARPVGSRLLRQAGDSLYLGQGFHTDVILAAVYAYMDALSYLAYCELDTNQIGFGG